MTVSNIPVFFIDGVVKRKNDYAPVLKEKMAIFNVDLLKDVCREPSKWLDDDVNYFRVRIFCQIAASSCIISASFTPKQLDKSRVLFFQAKQLNQPIGFFAPFLSKKDRAAYGAESYLPGPRLVKDEITLHESIEEVGAAYLAQLGNFEDTAAKINTYYADVFICVKLFLEDTHYNTMTLSYIEPSGTVISRSWIKDWSSLENSSLKGKRLPSTSVS